MRRMARERGGGGREGFLHSTHDGGWDWEGGAAEGWDAACPISTG